MTLECFVTFFLAWLAIALLVEKSTPPEVKSSTSIVNRVESFFFLFRFHPGDCGTDYRICRWVALNCYRCLTANATSGRVNVTIG